LNLSEILPVYLVDRLYLSVAVTYLRQILHIWSVSMVIEINWYMSKICHGEPQNLEKFAAENRGP